VEKKAIRFVGIEVAEVSRGFMNPFEDVEYAICVEGYGAHGRRFEIYLKPEDAQALIGQERRSVPACFAEGAGVRTCTIHYDEDCGILSVQCVGQIEKRFSLYDSGLMLLDALQEMLPASEGEDVHRT
jgi:hypothetical protein